MRSWLYCPGNRPGMIINAGIYGADGVVLDLEDSVPPEEKDEARILTAGALEKAEFPNAAAVRINGLSTPWWQEDLEALVPAGVRIIRIPKVEDPEELTVLTEVLDGLETAAGRTAGEIRLQAILETPRGIVAAALVAAVTPRLTGLCFGAEDYCTALGISRTGPAFALDYPRSRVACAAAAFGLEAWDTIWSRYQDPAGLEEEALRARCLGFSGKSVIHPDQIGIVNRVFSSTKEELEWARRIVGAAEEAAAGGQEGVFSLDGSMVDRPVIARAQRILEGEARLG